MAYRMTYENTLGEGSYQPDKKDRNLARRLGAQNPYVGAGQIFSIQGREFISRRGTPYDPNARSNNTTRFERYNRPAPKTAPIPKPVAAPVDSGPKPYTPQEIQGLISDTIAKATPPAPEPPPPPPKTIFSSSTILDRSPLDIQPASTSISNMPSFQRRSSGGLNQLKINQTLNV